MSPLPAAVTRRPLGRTGWEVDAFSLGGEGILRTRGRSAEAVPVVLEALRLGVRYFDTAPAYEASQDYYGEAFAHAGPAARDGVFLASKTHDRTRDGSLRLLDQSLRRLRTDRLDLWQLHDLRSVEDLDAIFGRGGALEAAVQAKAEGRVKNLGITGHADPLILVEAMRRFEFDTVLCAINPADRVRSSFIDTVVSEARRKKMGIIGMKALAAGRLIQDRAATVEELIRYGSTFADTVIVGCSSPSEVQHNVDVAKRATPLTTQAITELQARVHGHASRYDYFKA